MSKPLSPLFHKTIGEKNHHYLKIPPNQATQNLIHVVLWANKLADELSKISKRKRDKFNTASVAYDESTGKYYYGRNKGIEINNTPKNSILFGDSNHSGVLPQQSFNNYTIGNCSEVDAINNALNDGAALKNLHLTTIHTTSGSLGKPKPACENCTFSFKGKVKRNYTGWHKEN